jgi:hypothetical protein
MRAQGALSGFISGARAGNAEPDAGISVSAIDRVTNPESNHQSALGE